jgi:hypothetical protein
MHEQVQKSPSNNEFSPNQSQIGLSLKVFMNPSFKEVFPTTHSHLNNGDPGLLENTRVRISILKCFPTSLNPKKINNEVM